MYVTALYKLKSIFKNKADVQRDIDNILCVRATLACSSLAIPTKANAFVEKYSTSPRIKEMCFQTAKNTILITRNV